MDAKGDSRQSKIRFERSPVKSGASPRLFACEFLMSYPDAGFDSLSISGRPHLRLLPLPASGSESARALCLNCARTTSAHR